MNKIILIVVAVLVVIAAVGGYYYSKNYPVPVPMAPNQPIQRQAQSQNLVGSNVIEIQNFAFNPAIATIKVGDRVTWTNNDAVPHQIKSDTFNSAPLSQGGTFSFTFTAAGKFDYSCAIHPTMHGQIRVQ
jgi:plastocyanin